ncbi:hypothetical protein GCM10010300_34270 [Streptomyces olivaceoviridis]|nr:hypothetical protein GCM10010300_34270 [Streptomyces olivaceoviridis]
MARTGRAAVAAMAGADVLAAQIAADHANLKGTGRSLNRAEGPLANMPVGMDGLRVRVQRWFGVQGTPDGKCQGREGGGDQDDGQGHPHHTLSRVLSTRAAHQPGRDGHGLLPSSNPWRARR